MIQKKRDVRSKVMTNMLNSVALVKSLQWERFVAETISDAREDEMIAACQLKMCSLLRSAAILSRFTCIPRVPRARRTPTRDRVARVALSACAHTKHNTRPYYSETPQTTTCRDKVDTYE